MLSKIITGALFFGLVMGEAASQKASFTIFGKGCSRIHVRFGAKSLPILGKSMTIYSAAAWKAQGRTFLLTGASNRRYGSLKLPWDTNVLTTPKAWWCGSLLVSMDLFLVMPFTLSDVEVVFPIPNDTRLLGLRLYHQAILWHWALGHVPHRFDLSKGGISVVGRK